MSLIFQFPTNVELDMLTQEYMIQSDKFLGEEILPYEEYFSQRVRWDELDSERGMTSVHNMDTDPRVDDRPGSKVREYEAIPFKATELIKESELLRARELGTLGGVIRIDDMVTRRLRAREDKTRVRAEWLRWQSLQGGFTVNENGVYVQETFPVQHFYAITPYTNSAASTPLKDSNAVKLLFRGTGASSQGAIEYMNQTRLNRILENANDADLRGFRQQNVSTAFSLDELNKILSARGLPMMQVYDEGFIDLDGSFQNFIGDDVSIVVGKRPAGQKVGGFAMTPSLHRQKNGLPAPGFFTFIEVNDGPNVGAAQVSTAVLGASGNPKIAITGGVYGGTMMRYPRSIVVKHG